MANTTERWADGFGVAALLLMLALLAFAEPSPSSDHWPDLFAAPASPDMVELHGRARDLCGCESIEISNKRAISRRALAGSATAL